MVNSWFRTLISFPIKSVLEWKLNINNLVNPEYLKLLLSKWRAYFNGKRLHWTWKYASVRKIIFDELWKEFFFENSTTWNFWRVLREQKIFWIPENSNNVLIFMSYCIYNFSQDWKRTNKLQGFFPKLSFIVSLALSNFVQVYLYSFNLRADEKVRKHFFRYRNSPSLSQEEQQFFVSIH